MKTYNTIAAFHIDSEKDGILKLKTNKLYHWNIPKCLRDNPIKKGDIGWFRQKEENIEC